ncbi:MAG: lipid kinase, partial [Anaerovorax sp.]
HQENKNVKFFQTKRLRIESDQDVGTDIDGEPGAKFPLDIEVLEKRLKIATLKQDMSGSEW